MRKIFYRKTIFDGFDTFFHKANTYEKQSESYDKFGISQSFFWFDKHQNDRPHTDEWIGKRSYIKLVKTNQSSKQW